MIIVQHSNHSNAEQSFKRNKSLKAVKNNTILVLHENDLLIVRMSGAMIMAMIVTMIVEFIVAMIVTMIVMIVTMIVTMIIICPRYFWSIPQLKVSGDNCPHGK